ncbi:MAG: L,D-transpeptidase family protein, partial [Muribaculaceae bacterium]|nr:L,D-transpeptidase family protein [Muribaculaceae bacterium]
TEWLFTDDNGKTFPKKGQFGPRFIRLNCPNTSQIGIHGTVATWSIGRRTSHGCIRITNENILELVKHVTVGMPIIVVPGKKDMEVNASEDVEVAWIPSTLGAKQPKVKEAEDLKEKTDSISTESHPKENLTENGKQNSDWVERKDSTMNSEVPEPVEEDEHKTSAPINHIENPE